MAIGYYDILKILYGDDLGSIIDLLNSSVFVTNYKEEEKSTIIHTGFSFHTQTGQELEVLYKIGSHITIIQPRNPGLGLSLPRINGLNVKKGGNFKDEYFNTVFPMIICEFHYKTDERFTIMFIDDYIIRELWDKSDIKVISGKNSSDDSKFKISNIKVFVTNKGKTNKKVFPFNKTLKHKLFLDPNGWIYGI